jgi:hypothetical protein
MYNIAISVTFNNNVGAERKIQKIYELLQWMLRINLYNP